MFTFYLALALACNLISPTVWELSHNSYINLIKGKVKCFSYFII